MPIFRSWSGYNDELVWGALWLYKATGDNAYLEKAKNYYDQFGFQGKTSVLSWDGKEAGAQILLAQLTGEDKYLNDAKGVCQSYLNMPQSPGGRSHYLQWGSLRYAMNMAFICLQAADLTNDSSFQDYALKQAEYALGSSGRSFVVGFGNNPPVRPHHKAASCPINDWEPCDWNDYNSPDPNPHVLYGALIGGPQSVGSDWIADNRDDYVENEVTLDYNAGFQSLLAGLNQRTC